MTLQGYALPALAADVTPAQHRGLGTSLYRSAGDVGFLAAPIVFGLLADFTSVDLAMQALAMTCAGSSIALWFSKPRTVVAAIPQPPRL